MENKNTHKTSRFLSNVLRHKPENIGIKLDNNGYVDVKQLLIALAEHGHKITKDDLDKIVSTNDKKRFAYNEDGDKIRANQGHTVKVDLELKAKVPPVILYHGTVNNVLDTIKKDGLKSMSRHHVHLSADVETATKVGSRRGTPIILEIDTRAMNAQGYKFYQSDNGVWLTYFVPSTFIKVRT